MSRGTAPDPILRSLISLGVLMDNPVAATSQVGINFTAGVPVSVQGPGGVVTAWPGGGPGTEPDQILQYAMSDRITPLVTGTDQASFIAPCAFTLLDVQCGIDVVSGAPVQIDCKKNGTSVLSTKPVIATGGRGSIQSGGTEAVLSTTAVAAGDYITFDCTEAGSGSPTGLIATLLVTIP